MKTTVLCMLALLTFAGPALAQLTGPGVGANRFNGSAFGTNINGLGNAGGFGTGSGFSNGTTSSASFGSTAVGGFRYSGGLGNGAYPSGYSQNNFGSGANVYGGTNSAGISTGLGASNNVGAINPAAGALNSTNPYGMNNSGMNSSGVNAYGSPATGYLPNGGAGLYGGYGVGGYGIGGYGLGGYGVGGYGLGPYGGAYGTYGGFAPGSIVGDAFNVGALSGLPVLPGMLPGMLPGIAPGMAYAPGYMNNNLPTQDGSSAMNGGAQNLSVGANRRPPVNRGLPSDDDTRSSDAASASDLPAALKTPPEPAATINATRIQNRLHNVKTVNLQGVRVLMSGRTAILDGQVASAADAQLTARMVALEPGVGAVKNELKFPEDSTK